MIDPLHSLKPKHNVPVRIDLSNVKDKDLMNRIVHLNNSVTQNLLEICQLVYTDNREIPCSQCVKDMSLLASDLAVALQELSEKK